MKKHLYIDFTVETWQDRVDFGHFVVGYLDTVHTDVCGRSVDVRQAFEKKLERNRRLFAHVE